MVDPLQLGPLMAATSGVGPAAATSPSLVKRGPAESGSRDFKAVLMDHLEEVNRLQQEADQGVQRLMTGETENVAEVFATVNKAGIAFDLLMEIRNKLTDAYQEIQQMRL